MTKRREIFLHHHVRIHLDRVEGLGSFMELEAVFDGSTEAESAQRALVEALMARLGLGAALRIATSYEALVPPPPSESEVSADRRSLPDAVRGSAFTR